MIVGSISSRSPFVTATLVIPRLGTRTRLDFLIDTGASTSVVHPVDSGKVPLDWAKDFEGADLVAIEGVGGVVREFTEPCILLLTHERGVVDRVRVNMNFAAATDYNLDYPSLIGTDVIRHYKLTYHLSENLVSLE